jgi:glucose-1-phosphate cytidylyltransferase
MIKEYFINYFMHNSDLTVDLGTNQFTIHNSSSENFKVTLVDTGLETYTAGRLKRVLPYIQDEDFLLTYGDGVADVNINEVIDFHKSKGKICTMTAIQAGSRFGVLRTDENDNITKFEEKPQDEGSWINGGFFVINSKIKNYLHCNADFEMWERQPMEDLAKDNQIVAYKHKGFWKCMDTLRDKETLEEMWQNNPLWKVWS